MRPSFLDDMSWAMAEVYGAVTDRILVNLARYFPYRNNSPMDRDLFDYQARMLAQMGQVNRETAEIIAQSLGGADDALRQALEAAIIEALKGEESALRRAAKKGLLRGGGLLPPEVTPNQMQAFRAYYRQSADKLNLVNTVMLESTQAVYRATVQDAAARIGRTQSILNAGAGEVVTGVSAWNTAMHDAVAKMVDNGLTGFIDHAGRKWSPEAYAAMDIRTTMFNTARAAVWERNEAYGNDLYQVSSHNGARPLCYPWQGKVISRTDAARDVEDLYGETVHVYAQSETTYGQAGGLFGVNCKHYPMAFIPGFSTLKGKPQDPEENEKSYEQSQTQRTLERRLRQEKRDLAVMQAQGADEAAIRAQREHVRTASANLDTFCDETGRARRKNREFTPIDAKFPPSDSYDPTTFPRGQKERVEEFFESHSLTEKAQSGIIVTKLNSDPNSADPMDAMRYNRMREGLERRGIKVIQARGDDLKYLDSIGAESSYGNGYIMHRGEIPSASAMFEETIHAAQARIYGEMRNFDPTELAAREIAAQNKLIANSRVYRFTSRDASDIKRNLAKWAEKFRSLTGKGYDPNDRDSEYYRGV